MNIFYTDSSASEAARSLPDKHIVKMPSEAVQMLVQACKRHGLEPFVLTKTGTFHKGGYANHPCTQWCGDSYLNAQWVWQWAMSLCREYTARYGKTHFAEQQLERIALVLWALPDCEFTEPPLAMPDECKTDDTVESYRNCIRLKVHQKPDSFVWRKGTPAPSWV